MKGVKISGRPLFLDMQATSPVDPRVLDAMLPYYISQYGNPYSRTHLYGWESESAVETARSQVANSLIAPRRKSFLLLVQPSPTTSLSRVICIFIRLLNAMLSPPKLSTSVFLIRVGIFSNDGLVDLDKLRAAIRPDMVGFL